MRILFVLPYVPSQIRVRPYHFIRELAQRHVISVLATDHPQVAEDVVRLRQFCQMVDVVPLNRTAAIRSCLLGVVRGDPLQACVCQSAAFDERLNNLLNKQQFDLVHLEHLRAARLGWVMPHNMPTLFDSVDSISLLLSRTLRSSHSWRQRLIAALELRRTQTFEARIAKRFDRTIVTSADDAQVLQTLAPGANISVVPNGVDLAYFQPGDGPRDPATIVFWGKMSYHANATAALYFARRVFPLIRAARADAQLLIVGSRPPAAIRRLVADPNIIVTGYVTDLRTVVSRATVAVCPVTVKVGIQNKILEAMALGLPVVSTLDGASGLQARAGQELLVARDAAEFARQVCELLTDRTRASAVGQAGRRYVEQHHRWDAATQQLEALYAEAVDLHRGEQDR